MGKLKKFALIGIACLAIAAIGKAMVAKYNGYLVNETGLAYSKTYSIPLNSYGIDNLAFTATASSVTFAAVTFSDGQASTGTITVTANTGLSAVSASDSLTIVSTNTLAFSTVTLTVNGIVLTQGVQWFSDITTTQTALSLYNAITKNVSNVRVSTGGTGATIFSTATIPGTYGNNMTFVSNVSTNSISFGSYTSSAALAAASSFSGGKDSATISINGFFVGFTPGANSSSTALSIAQNINSNTSLKTIVISSVSDAGTIVFTTSTQVGSFTNYIVTSSTDSSLTIGGSTKTVAGLAGASIGQMWGGANSAYALGTSTSPNVGFSTTTTIINATSHGLTTALAVLLSTSGTNTITPLVNGTTYYSIPLTPNSLSLATTSTAAVLGIPVILTSSQTKTTTDSFTLTPLISSGVPTYRWEVSNDGMNWQAYTTTIANVTVSSVTLSTSPYATGGVSNLWDFGPIDYAYLRLNVVYPGNGAIRLQVVGNGKNTSQ